MIAINVQTAENTNKKQQYRDVGDSVQRPLAGLILMAKRIDFAHTDRPDSARKFSVAESADSASNLSRDQVQVTGGSDGAAGSPSVVRHSNIY
jgi:hypothetical protein